MLKKYNVLTLEKLKNIVCLNDCDDKFNSPIFVFDNRQNCDWFKKRLLKELDVPLFNLKVYTAEDFVTAYLLDNDKNIKILDVKLIRDLICKILISDIDGKMYYEQKAESGDNGWKSVKTFIESHIIEDDSNSKINFTNLYDFAKTLSNLFSDYTINYPNNKYLDELFKTEDKAKFNYWQIELFSDVIKVADKLNSDNRGRYFKYDVLYNIFKNRENNLPKLKSDVYYFSQDDNKLKVENLYKAVLKTLVKKTDEKKLIQFNIEELQKLLYSMDGSEQSDNYENKLIRLISAPSKVREIEGVHGEICNLIKEKKVDSFDDILILAPNPCEYKTALHQVFSIAKGDKEYPFIPINLADTKVENDLLEGLRTLFSIAEKGFYTRQDFFKLASNMLIKEKYNINDESINVFESLVEKLSVYRNRKNKADWQDALHRTLLYVLMDNECVKVKEIEEYEKIYYQSENSAELNPFRTIGITPEILASFSSLINLLEDWNGYFKEISRIYDYSYSIDRIGEISIKLANFFDISKKINDDDVIGEVFAYRSLVSKINILCQIYKNNEIPHQILKLALFDSICEITVVDDLSVSTGIRISSISLDSVICCKYLFMIGMSSANFSIQKHENVLDIRGENFVESVQSKEKSNFKSQINMCSEFCVSFVDKNLKKDEDFYLAPEIQGLEGFGSVENSEKRLKLSIDENRSGDKLWTAREFRLKKINKKWNEKNGEGTNNTSPNYESNNENNDEKKSFPKVAVKISDIKKFLTDPFQFRIKELFGEKWGVNVQKDVFEPVDFDVLTKSEVSKKIIKLKLKNISDEDIKKEIIKTSIDLPDGKFFEVAFEYAKNEANSFFDIIKNTFSIKEAKVDEPIDFILKIDNEDIRIKGVASIYNGDWKDTKFLNVFDYSRDHLNSYITALCLIASYKNREGLKKEDNENSDLDKEITVNLFDKEGKNQSFCFSVNKVVKTLQDILKKMYIKKYNKCMPYKFITDDKVNTYTFAEYIEKLNGGYDSPWQYFDNKILFNPEIDCGYSENDFKKNKNSLSIWMSDVDDQKSLFPYLQQKQDNNKTTQENNKNE